MLWVEKNLSDMQNKIWHYNGERQKDRAPSTSEIYLLAKENFKILSCPSQTFKQTGNIGQ